jgi:RHS repeat-associated protein
LLHQPSTAFDGLGNRLATVTTSRTPAQYTYDAFGQRLIKVTTGTTLYGFDLSGHLLEESAGSASITDYIYLDGRPVATLTPSTGALAFLLDDRLGTPQVAADGGQNIVWSATYQPFGLTGPISGSIVQNLRLPGQYADMESGFNYNYFRDYVPGLGRYLESDPIGLSGGLNTYNYVNGNPLTNVDAQGTGFVDCTVALAELIAANANLQKRVAEIIANGGQPDAGHIKALNQAVNRVENAQALVVKHCGCYAGAAAAILAAAQAIEAAAPYLAAAPLL